MKVALTAAGIDFRDCVEKPDLLARCAQVRRAQGMARPLIKPCMTDIYLHIAARMDDHTATRSYATSSATVAV